jgi:hypothetical protein
MLRLAGQAHQLGESLKFDWVVCAPELEALGALHIPLPGKLELLVT